MRRTVAVLALPLLLILATLVLPTALLVGSAGSPAHSGGLTTYANSSTSGGPTVDGIVCPEAPILVLGITFNCVTLLDLTEAFVIMFTVVITLYIFKDADRAELPGEAETIPVTADEELALRIQRDRETEADKAYEAQLNTGGKT